MACESLVDWRGKPINTKVHGGVRAAWYLYFLIVVNFLVHVPNLQNMTTYLREVMHMKVSDASTTLTNFIGAMCGFALLGGFLSDSYITCARTMLLSVPLVILGYGLLTLQSHFPWLHPAPCNSSEAAADASTSNCRHVDGWRSALLYIALYTIALGEGVMRACIPALGSDQFDGDNPSEARQQSSFFNWFTFCLSIGSIAGLILIVWLEDTKGWDVGFGLSALLILVALLVSAAGLPLYRNRVPQGSALTRVLQVFVVAFKNRKLELPEKMEETQQNNSLNLCEDQHRRRRRWTLVGLQRGKSRGDQDRSTHAASRLQLNGGPRRELSANRVHRPAGRDDEHEAGEGARPPRDALHHPLHLPDADAGGLRPAPRAPAAAAHGLHGGHHAATARCRGLPDRVRRPGRRGGRREEEEGHGGGRRPHLPLLARAAVLPDRRGGHHLLRRAARVLHRRGARRHEVHRRGVLLVPGRDGLPAGHAAGEAGEQGHPQQQCPWVAGGEGPQQ